MVLSAAPTLDTQRVTAWASTDERVVYSLLNPRQLPPSRPGNSWTGWQPWSYPRTPHPS